MVVNVSREWGSTKSMSGVLGRCIGRLVVGVSRKGTLNDEEVQVQEDAREFGLPSQRRVPNDLRMVHR
jgi:hypothetical protein